MIARIETYPLILPLKLDTSWMELIIIPCRPDHGDSIVNKSPDYRCSDTMLVIPEG